MTRVFAVVEGATEERFLRRVVGPHLETAGVYLFATKVLHKNGLRGGGSRWGPWQRQVESLLKQHKGHDAFVTTMLDLYAIPKDVPGWTPASWAPGGKKPGPQRADAMIAAIREKIPDRSFIPYIQVHEFETLLFSDLQTLQREAPDLVEARAFARLLKTAQSQPPEAIDDGPDTAPSKRILGCARGFRKTTHGVQTAAAIGLAKIRQLCPRFDAWISSLEALPAQPG